MSDDEFDAQVVRLFSARSGSVAVSLRVAADLLGRVTAGRACRQAARAGFPYQTIHEVDPRGRGVAPRAAPRVDGNTLSSRLA